MLFSLAVRAKTVEEVVKNRPVAGILDIALAVEHKVFHYLSVLHIIKMNQIVLSGLLTSNLIATTHFGLAFLVLSSTTGFLE